MHSVRQQVGCGGAVWVLIFNVFLPKPTRCSCHGFVTMAVARGEITFEKAQPIGIEHLVENDIFFHRVKLESSSNVPPTSDLQLVVVRLPTTTLAYIPTYPSSNPCFDCKESQASPMTPSLKSRLRDGPAAGRSRCKPTPLTIPSHSLAHVVCIRWSEK